MNDLALPVPSDTKKSLSAESFKILRMSNLPLHRRRLLLSHYVADHYYSQIKGCQDEVINSSYARNYII